MKGLLMTLAAAAALATASQAFAHPDDDDQDSGYSQRGGYGQGNDWQDQSGGYDYFQQQYQHDIQGIRHGLSDGSLSRYQASVYYQELQNIQRAAWISQQRGGYDDRYIQRRLELLHARMHQAHEGGHERQRYDSYYDQGDYYRR